MKIAGIKITEPNVEILIIPRGNENIVFKAQAVLSMEDFDKLFPVPKPPVKIAKGGDRIEDVESPAYKASINNYNSKRIAYLILKSLQATEGLEWETVDMSDPSTWSNWQKELSDSGFSDIEVNRIINAVMTANCLNEAKLEEARKRFLLSQLEPEKTSSSPPDEQITMPSGGPVNVSA